MNRWIDVMWMIAALPLAAALVILGVPRRGGAHRWAGWLATASMAGASVISLLLFVSSLGGASRTPVYRNIEWLEAGALSVRVGWVADGLSVGMLTMVCLVGTLIFAYSTSYMAEDERRDRFFGYLSFFAAAMLGVVMANSLLFMFVCWELVGLASYLLIGFWFHKPSAAAAARKAFLTTRVGDIGFFAGLLIWGGATGTLLFFDGGRGCLEPEMLGRVTRGAWVGGVGLATVVSLLLIWGAMGKSGQAPLHGWLPDAMEGPTPVSALIHAATMVAAGVYLLARVYPLLAGAGGEGAILLLAVMTWVGAITAVGAAAFAVVQTDLKKILAYSTVSQLGYMFVGLGTGGVGVGMLHLITHACFKALLFLGAGSVIHGCGGEQDIRKMGGLRGAMPVTFATYAVGMMALTGVPFVFSGYWSKEEILSHALHWKMGWGPFALLAMGAFLTAFYMMRQVVLVFFGESGSGDRHQPGHGHGNGHGGHGHGAPHESPGMMTGPLILLAVATVGLTAVCTPWWPWLMEYLGGGPVKHAGGVGGVILMVGAAVVVGLAFLLGWRCYRPYAGVAAGKKDPIEAKWPVVHGWLRGRFGVDEALERVFVGGGLWVATMADLVDRGCWRAMGSGLAWFARGLSSVSRVVDEYGLNRGFDAGCAGVSGVGGWLARRHNGQVTRMLRLTAAGVLLMAGVVVWWVRAGR